MDTITEMQIESTVDALTDQVETLGAVWRDHKDGDWGDETDPDAPTLNDLATSAVVALHNAFTLVKELREAGADIAEAPVEEEALITCMVNAKLIHRDMEATVAHMESVLERVRS